MIRTVCSRPASRCTCIGAPPERREQDWRFIELPVEPSRWSVSATLPSALSGPKRLMRDRVLSGMRATVLSPRKCPAGTHVRCYTTARMPRPRRRRPHSTERTLTSQCWPTGSPGTGRLFASYCGAKCAEVCGLDRYTGDEASVAQYPSSVSLCGAPRIAAARHGTRSDARPSRRVTRARTVHVPCAIFYMYSISAQPQGR